MCLDLVQINSYFCKIILVKKISIKNRADKSDKTPMYYSKFTTLASLWYIENEGSKEILTDENRFN